MTFYPAFLDLRGKPCLVVGGGKVAYDKARALAKAGARVTAVAPEIRPALARLKGVRPVRRRFRPSDLGTAESRPWLVVAATDDRALNEEVSRLCAWHRIWMNAVDQPALCGFIVPATARRGPLTFAVSTGGASPALAGFLGRRLREEFGPEYAVLARILRGARRRLLRLPMDRRRRLLAEVISARRLRGLRTRGAAPLRAFLRRRLASKNI